ncbi:hypothetical protein KNP414_07758 [Paenibacillus mucilaginosus KNP414]|uniref:Uncharacterized protein n=1 Tax=Paenibacillus mucilaginosus (strain KNP414) TaxID=1036673 RepID=F8FGU3_PAEMK|nr:hypothetical protein KNP414_07758 [Paenibacillus mucilaginosus KNP414]
MLGCCHSASLLCSCYVLVRSGRGIGCRLGRKNTKRLSLQGRSRSFGDRTKP